MYKNQSAKSIYMTGPSLLLLVILQLVNQLKWFSLVKIWYLFNSKIHFIGRVGIHFI